MQKDKLTSMEKANQAIAVAVMGYLLLIYLLPEKIMLVTLAFGFILVGYYVLFVRHLHSYSVQRISFLFAFLLILLFSSMVNGLKDQGSVVEFALVQIMSSMLILLPMSKKGREKQIKGLMVVAVVALIGCFVQIIFPDLLVNINRAKYDVEKFNWFIDFFNSRYIVGFSYQTGITAYYLTICCVFLFVELIEGRISRKSKIVYVALAFSSFIFIFLTAKRMFILLVALLLIYIYAIYNKKNILKVTGLLILLLIGLVVLVTNTEIGARLIQRMEAADPTRGRMGLYAAALSQFWEAPFLGQGLYNIVDNLYAHNLHNIYLQILTEVGFGGFVTITSFFIINLFSSIKEFRIQRKYGEDTRVITKSIVIQLIFLGWGMTGNPLFDVYPMIAYSIAVGVSYNEAVENRRNRFQTVAI